MDKENLEQELDDIEELIEIEKDKSKPDYSLIKRLLQDKANIEFKLGKY